MNNERLSLRDELDDVMEEKREEVGGTIDDLLEGEEEVSKHLVELRTMFGMCGVLVSIPVKRPSEGLPQLVGHSYSERLVVSGLRCWHCRRNRSSDPERVPAFRLEDSYVFCNSCGAAMWPSDVINYVFRRRIIL